MVSQTSHISQLALASILLLLYAFPTIYSFSYVSADGIVSAAPPGVTPRPGLASTIAAGFLIIYLGFFFIIFIINSYVRQMACNQGLIHKYIYTLTRHVHIYVYDVYVHYDVPAAPPEVVTPTRFGRHLFTGELI